MTQERVLHVDLTPADEGGYIVTVREIPNCVTQGDTEKEALENARDAITLCLQEMQGSNEDGTGEPVRPHVKEIVYAY
jgi:predicted RNase H-like HicB family nuclease